MIEAGKFWAEPFGGNTFVTGCYQDTQQICVPFRQGGVGRRAKEKWKGTLSQVNSQDLTHLQPHIRLECLRACLFQPHIANIYPLPGGPSA